MDQRLSEAIDIAGEILAIRQKIDELENELFRLEKRYEAKVREGVLSTSRDAEDGRILDCDGIAAVLTARTARHREILSRFAARGADKILSVKDIDLLRGGDGSSTATSYGDTMNSIKQLLKWGLIERDSGGVGYQVTNTGFLAAAQMEAASEPKQGKEKDSP